MLKKLLTLSLTVLLAGGIFAQEQGNNALHAKKGGHGAKSISFSASDIQYWVGTGSNSAVVIIGWDDNPNGNFALAWGVHWNGNATAVNMLDTIATYDSRVAYAISSGFVTSIGYNDGTLISGSSASYWCYTINGAYADAYSVQQMSNNDVMEISSSCYFTLTSATAATNPNAPSVSDASIDASDIVYWVGEGSNQVVFAVNWADTALAWGYRFNGESVTVPDVMNAIAAADPRFSYQNGSWGLDDINFTTDNGTLGITPGNYWWSLLNHVSGMGMSDVLHNGDFYKWGDLSVAVITDSTWVSDWGGYWDYTYVWPYTINPVSIPGDNPEVGPFCGAVGTEGCTAIAYNDSRIKGWAITCTLVRGSQNISDPNAPVVDYGDESEAIGPATTSTMDVVSLGDGGYATLTFTNPIKNGEGYDFAVFENSFNDYFLELAFVEVSSDGVNFVRFPATSLTQTQTQVESHVDPTFINNLAGKYRVGYGTPFDLEELRDSANIDINNITHVRVVDVVGSIDPQYATYDAYGHMVNDPFPTITYSSGFDLDGICVLNYATEGIAENDNSIIRQIYPNPSREMVHINITAQNSNQQVILYDMTGRQVYTGRISAGDSHVTLATSTLPNGVYMLRIGDSVEKLVVRH